MVKGRALSQAVASARAAPALREPARHGSSLVSATRQPTEKIRMSGAGVADGPT